MEETEGIRLPWNPRDFRKWAVQVTLLLLCLVPSCFGAGEEKYAYFSQENSSEILLKNTVWNLLEAGNRTGFSFRTCSNGELLSQQGASGDFLKLLIINGSLDFSWSIAGNKDKLVIGSNLNSNDWYTFYSHLYLGNLYLNVSYGSSQINSEIIYNSTFRTYFRNIQFASDETLRVGNGFTGCIMEGPNVIFINNTNIQWTNITWSSTPCPLSESSCSNGGSTFCLSLPCMYGGTCINEENSYRCECPHLYNGTDCENDLSTYGCVVEPCLNGGTCVTIQGSKPYRCECIDGYAGYNCELPINECGSDPCENGTPCIDLVGNYTCNCSGSGFSGRHCENDIDECLSRPCGTGSCYNNMGSYTCGCQEGFDGDGCQEVDECNSNPCQYGGTCHDGLNQFTCTCVDGYTGTRCETNIDDCANVTCHENSYCQDGVNNYQCICQPGYSGVPPNCIDSDMCDPDPCQHGSQCSNQVTDFRCQCLAGYTGKRCETDINECDPNPCRYGSCTQGIGSYSCSCQLGYTGTNCDVDIDDCQLSSSVPCQHGGTCKDQVNGYSCDCVTGYTGSACETDIDECAPDPCRNGGVCSQGVGFFSCDCPYGYNGTTCENIYDYCVSDPCVNEGTCVNLGNGFICNCLSEWMGDTCSEVYDACSPTLLNCLNGLCSTTKPSRDFSCSCDAGYTGTRCETDIDDCIGHACVSPKVCFDEVNAYRCDCPLGYTGSDCLTDIDECAGTPCRNGATCRDLIGKYECDCQQRNVTVDHGGTIGEFTYLEGFRGDNCEININECEYSPPICLNSGTCEDSVGSYQCKCGHDGGGNYFVGTNCEITTSYCFLDESIMNDLPACKNNGTCIGLTSTFRCECIPGFCGSRCETNIDECESNPCHYNGTCIDGINGYTCDCIPGITGDNCEINIDECDPHPCNNGSCIDGINQFTCNCTDTGFKGDTCEINIDDCEPGQCQHGSTCQDLIKDYICWCNNGYNGKDCEVDIDECQLNNQPCQYNGTCLEKSDIVNYNNSQYTVFENLTFSYATAAGYLCECIPGITGENCEINIDDCQHDLCQNGATCEDLINGFYCQCTIGFAGTFCNISTTLSFDSGSYVLHDISGFERELSAAFRFRTTLPDVFLFSWLGLDSTGLFVTLELKSGALVFGYHSNDVLSGLQFVSITKTFNNADWHAVELVKGVTNIVVRVTSSLCGSSTDCTLDVTFNSNVHSSLQLYFGDINSSLGISSIQEGFIGCMEDISVSDKKLVPELTLPNFIQLTTGCERQEQCFQNTCNNHGTCVDRWKRFRCDCRRPYLGNTCDQAYVAATFGHMGNRSSASFNFTLEQKAVLQTTIDLSFFIRSRKPDGLILFMGSQIYNTFLAVELIDSHVAVQYNMCGNTRYIVTDDGVDYADGNQHFVRFYRNDANISFSVDSYSSSASIIEGCQFNAANFYLGGEVPSQLRRRGTSTVSTGSVGDFSATTFYKGSIQDVQVNDISLQFYPLQNQSLSTLVPLIAAEKTNLEEGEVTDPVCALTSPCENNATCTDVFFNDFSCKCPPDYRGKNCSEFDFCLTGQCPDGSVCQSRQDGLECISNATFDGVSTYAKYSHNLSPSTVVQTFSLKFRTLVKNGWMLVIQSGDFYYKIRVIGGELFLMYNLQNNLYKQMSIPHDISNSEWYSLVVKETTDTLTLTLNNDDYSVNITRSSSLLTRTEDLSAIVKSTNAVFVIGNDGAYNERNPYYQGCLSEVRIGGILLPFFKDDLFINNTSPEKFFLGDNRDLKNGCAAGLNCPFSSCRHGASCVEDYHTYTCSCPTGYVGQWCQDLADFCSPSPCNNGYCTSLMKDFQCTCPSAYSGTQCETDVNECSDGVCLNNGSCQNLNGSFSCICAAGFTGLRCEVLLSDNCSNNPCQNGQCNDLDNLPSGSPQYNCTCMPGYEGYTCDTETDYCRDGPCKNGGNCTSDTANQSHSCECRSGFSGQNCDTNINDCPNGVCKNGGVCVDGVDSYNCNCTANWQGPTCEMNVDECSTTQPCQNGGRCTDSTGSYTCNCAGTGYTGMDCQNDIDECTDPTTCRNGGTCMNTIGDFECNCSLGYQGKRCDEANCTLVDCQNNGTCLTSSNPSKWTCNCLQYYEGDLCEIEGPCVAQPCSETNTRECNQNITAFSYQCVCEQGWQGQNCTEDIDECAISTPCRNGATCRNEIGSFLCECAPGYTGNICDININECEPKPCQNNGICTDLIADFSCNCDGTGYEGKNCSQDVNECMNTPCLHESKCFNKIGSYICECTVGYTGTNCGTEINECDDDPCQNNGYCIDGIGNFTCNCTGTGYTNVNNFTCIEDLDECVELSPCQNGAGCTNTIGDYSCQCARDFSGKNCEIEHKQEMQDITWYIVGPVVAVVLLIIIIVVVVVLRCMKTKRATRGAYSPSRQEVTGSRVELGNVMKKPPLERLI